MAREREFTFSDEKWDKMEQKLDEFHARKRYNRLLWATVLPLLGLLGALGFVIGQLRETQHSLLELKQEVQLSRSSQMGNVATVDSLHTGRLIQKDTVYQHIVVKRYDTIFQTVVQRTLSEAELKPKEEDKVFQTSKIESAVVSGAIPSSQKALPVPHVSSNDKKPSLDSANGQVQMPPLSISSDKERVPFTHTPVAPTKVDTSLHKITANEPLTNETLPKNTDSLSLRRSSFGKGVLSDSISDKTDSLSRSAVAMTHSADSNRVTLPVKEAETIPPLSNMEEKKAETTTETAPKPIIKPLKWGRLETGLSMGVASMAHRNVSMQKGFSSGIKLHWLLGERFKIIGETQFLSLNYSLDSLTRYFDVPTVNPPTLNDVLTGLETDQKFGQVALGVQYDVMRRRLRPFVGLSLVGEWALDGKYAFLFTNSLTNKNTVVLARRHRSDFNNLYTRMNVGLSYPMSKHWQLQIEGSMDAPFERDMSSRPIGQFKGSVLYRF
ncbi:MAG: hypothetical protein JNL70_17550 [Saprospiraceae bacterium]|nr:hypothetical protein [Saprospiraceae bacterium]